MKKLTGILVLMLVAAVLLPLTAYAAASIDVDRDASLVISYADCDKALAGAQFDVYHIADLSGNYRILVTDEFKPYSVMTDGLDQNGWRDLAVRLKAEAQLHHTPMISQTTDGTGNISFRLKPGMYLVVGHALTLEDGKSYVCDPFMAFLPVRDEQTGEWVYNVTAKPKYTSGVTVKKILKVWDPENKERWKDIKEIKVDVICDGELYETVVLTAENGWAYEWTAELDPNHEHDWTFKEVKVEGFEATYEIIGTTLMITNTYKPNLDELPLEKIVKGEPKENAEFTFILKAKQADYPMPEGSANGVKEIKHVGAGHTQFGAINCTEPGEYIYTISEKNDGKAGYVYDSNVYTLTLTVTEDETGLHTAASLVDNEGKTADVIAFTNKYKNDLPQTGLLWWPVPLLLAAGLALILIGMLRRRGN